MIYGEDEDVLVLDTPVEEEAANENEAEPEELVVQIGDEEPEPEQHGEALRNMRQRIKELTEENKKLKGPAREEKQPELPPRPKQSDPGIDFDEEKFAEALLEWTEKKRQHEAKQTEAERKQAQEQERWQAKLAKFEEGKAALKAPDLDVAEAVVTENLSQTQMAIVVEGAKDPALVFYALGKNPKKAGEIAQIENPIEFARAIFELEGQLKVTRKSAPAPEKTVGGKMLGGGTVDNTLSKLREEAERTGNYSKVLAYKRSKRA